MGGTPSDFARFDSAWPEAKAWHKQGLLVPVTGNHDYQDLANTITPQGTYNPQAIELFIFFSMTNQNAYKTVDAGPWRIFFLNDACWALPDWTGLDNATLKRVFAPIKKAQTAWLNVELAKATRDGKKIVGCWHHPHVLSPDMIDIYTKFQTAGAALILNAHAHQYANFGGLVPPMIVNGTGGAQPDSYKLPGSTVGFLNQVGVVKCDLHSDGSFHCEYVSVLNPLSATFKPKVRDTLASR
jgi:hypothetical protein